VGADFGVYHAGGSKSSFCLREPSGVLTSVMSVIFVALIQIRARHPGRYLIVTDSMSIINALQTRKVALRTHSLVNETKETCWWLKNNGYEIHMMWIPSHLRVRSNKRAYQHAPVRPPDLLPLSRVRLLEGWQSGWDGSDMGRYAYSVWSLVSFMPWLRRFDGNQVIISMINRISANNSCLWSHLGQIGIVENPMCVCALDYEIVDHVL
jgi:hypothetical protein